MGKLIFAAVVLVVGLVFYYALKRQADLFRNSALALVPRVVQIPGSGGEAPRR